jgi:hypothetical protein
LLFLAKQKQFFPSLQSQQTIAASPFNLLLEVFFSFAISVGHRPDTSSVDSQENN